MRILKATAFLAVFAGVVPAQADDWTGAYIGIGAGYGGVVHDLTVEPAAGIPVDGSLSIAGIGGDGGLFTLGVGADYQVNSRFLIGAFFDYDWTDLETEVGLSVSGPLNAEASANVSVEDLWSIGGRLGYIVSPSTLLFLSAGYARADISDLNANFGGGTVTVLGIDKIDGYFIGGGAEVKLTKALSIKGEYRYTDLDSDRVDVLPGVDFLGVPVGDFVSAKLDPDIQAGRLSLNYRFGLGRSESEEAPVAAAAGSWSQFYVGVGGAYTFGNNELSLAPGPLVDDDVQGSIFVDGLGSTGGGVAIEAGFDRQYDDKFVFGLFVDYTRHNNEFEAGLRLEDFIRGTVSYEIEDQFSIGGRAGYLVTPSTLLFGTVGYTHLWLSDTMLSNVVFLGSPVGSTVLADNGSFGGVFLGTGFETKLTNTLSLKAEYRYTFADSERIDLLPGVNLGGGFTVNDFVQAELQPDIQSIRMSLDYRFDFGGRDEAPLK